MAISKKDKEKIAAWEKLEKSFSKKVKTLNKLKSKPRKDGSSQYVISCETAGCMSLALINKDGTVEVYWNHDSDDAYEYDEQLSSGEAYGLEFMGVYQSYDEFEKKHEPEQDEYYLLNPPFSSVITKEFPQTKDVLIYAF